MRVVRSAPDERLRARVCHAEPTCKSGERLTRVGLRRTLDSSHRLLARSSRITRGAILLRNQANSVIRYHLTASYDPLENGEAWLAAQIAPNASTFIDVGAFVGDWTADVLPFAEEGSKGLLFEPAVPAAMKLRERFGQSSSLEIVEAAVADAEGELPFYEGSGRTSSLSQRVQYGICRRETDPDTYSRHRSGEAKLATRGFLEDRCRRL